MKNRLKWALLVLSIFAVSPRAVSQNSFVEDKADSLALLSAPWEWTDLGGGAEAASATVHMYNSVQSISIIRYPMRKFHTEVLEEDGPDAKATSLMAGGNGWKMAINGSYFTREVKPATFVKDDGKVLSSTSPEEGFRVNGILLLGRSGRRLSLRTCTPGEDEVLAKGSRDALSAGPMLREGGRDLYDPAQMSSGFYGGRHPRSIIGYTGSDVAPKGNLASRRNGRACVPAGRMVYLIVVDGRFPSQADGMSIPELIYMCKVLGLESALNLDGGGSSSLWDEGLGVLNHPYDNLVFDHKGERRVPNVVAVKKR